MQKNVYPYEFMDHWEKFNETSLPERKDFYSHLSIEDITDEDYTHAKGVCTDYQLKNLREYYDLCAQSDTLLLADVYGNYRKMCI